MEGSKRFNSRSRPGARTADRDGLRASPSIEPHTVHSWLSKGFEGGDSDWSGSDNGLLVISEYR